MTGTIVLATDGSVPALAATAKAVEIARDRKAKLLVLTVTEQTPVTGMEKLAEDKVLLRIPGVDGREYARAMAARQSLSAEFVTREGPVVGEIIRAASEAGAEMIVLGSSDPRGISGFVLGNVAEAVVRQADCTVLVVKPAENEVKAILSTVTALREPKRTGDISDITGSPRFKLGLGLFGVYIAAYAAFTLVGSFDKNVFRQGLFGMNVALVSGMVLILLAIAMAVGYNWYAARMETSKGGN